MPFQFEVIVFKPKVSMVAECLSELLEIVIGASRNYHVKCCVERRRDVEGRAIGPGALAGSPVEMFVERTGRLGEVNGIDTRDEVEVLLSGQPGHSRAPDLSHDSASHNRLDEAPNAATLGPHLRPIDTADQEPICLHIGIPRRRLLQAAGAGHRYTAPPIEPSQSKPDCLNRTPRCAKPGSSSRYPANQAGRVALGEQSPRREFGVVLSLWLR
jgi:hypothetical protein